MPKILMEKKQSFARPCSASERPFKLDKIFQASSLAQPLRVEHAIEIDQVELPTFVALFLDEEVGVAQVSRIQPCGMKPPQKPGEGLQERASLLSGPVRVLFSPVHIEGNLSEQRFTTVPALADGSGDASFERGQRARDRKPVRLEQSCAAPSSTRR